MVAGVIKIKEKQGKVMILAQVLQLACVQIEDFDVIVGSLSCGFTKLQS